MTDERHPSDQRRLLASAYLDDELAATDRARAEADPEVMAEVAAMRTVRSLVADVPAADAARRDAAIGAALAAMPAGGVHAPVRPSPSARRRSRWLAPLAAAAAAAVLLVGGVVALRSGTADEDDAGQSALSEQEAAATAGGEQTATGGGADANAGAAATTPAPAADLAEATAAEETSGASEVADRSQQIAESTEGASELSPDEAVLLRDVDDLRSFVDRANDAPPDVAAPAGGSPASGAPACDLGRFVAVGRYMPATGPPVEVEIFVDEATGEVVAADDETCAVVLIAPP